MTGVSRRSCFCSCKMTFEHHIFIDFENVREADIDLLEGHSAALTLVLGRQQKTLSLALVEALRRLPPEQVTLVQSRVAGRNSLDFVLACLVGRAVEGHPGVSVHIISKDRGFDSLIAHLRERGISAARHESLAGVPVLAPKTGLSHPGRPPATAAVKPAPVAPVKPPAAKKAGKDKPIPPVEERVDCLARRLAKTKSAGPQKRSTLCTYVRSQLGNKLTDKHVKETIDGLIQRGVLTISSTEQVVYTFGGELNTSHAGNDDDFDYGDLVPF